MSCRSVILIHHVSDILRDRKLHLKDNDHRLSGKWQIMNERWVTSLGLHYGKGGKQTIPYYQHPGYSQSTVSKRLDVIVRAGAHVKDCDTHTCTHTLKLSHVPRAISLCAASTKTDTSVMMDSQGSEQCWCHTPRPSQNTSLSYPSIVPHNLLSYIETSQPSPRPLSGSQTGPDSAWHHPLLSVPPGPLRTHIYTHGHREKMSRTIKVVRLSKTNVFHLKTLKWGLETTSLFVLAMKVCPPEHSWKREWFSLNLSTLKPLQLLPLSQSCLRT